MSKRKDDTAGKPNPRGTSPAGGSHALEFPPTECPRIGVISDTHGFLDPEVLEVFAGVDLIIHAGDIVDSHTLGALADVAPVIAVAGNLDAGDLAATLPRELTGDLGGVRFAVGHKRKRLLKRLSAGKLRVGPDGEPPDVVIFGHEHIPSALWVDGTLLLNPGTASSPHEEDDGPTVAILEPVQAGLSVHFVPLRHRAVEAAEED